MPHQEASNMSEKLQPSSKETVTSHSTIERAKEHLEKLKAQADIESKAHASSETLEKAKVAVESLAISGKEMTPSESNKDVKPSMGYVNRELKDMAFKRSLSTARRHMNAPSRTMSKIIHQPVVEKVSDAASVTVARPSGILGGGAFALIGSIILLWTTKHYGYKYNYLVFFMLFICGFIIGMITELVIHYFIRRKNNKK